MESEKCPSMTAAISKGYPEASQIMSTLADGLAVPLVGYNAYATVAPLLDRMVSFYSLNAFLNFSKSLSDYLTFVDCSGRRLDCSSNFEISRNRKMRCGRSWCFWDSRYHGRHGARARRKKVCNIIINSTQPSLYHLRCKLEFQSGLHIIWRKYRFDSFGTVFGTRSCGRRSPYQV